MCENTEILKEPDVQYLPLSNELEDIGRVIVDCAYTVHKKLGTWLT